MEKLVRHPWRGNLRELSHTVRTMTLFCEGDVILPEHVCFPPDLVETTADDSREPEAHSTSTGQNHRGKSGDMDLTLSAAVRRHVQFVYEQTNRNQRKTARLLGISRATLARHLKNTV
jgi:DNA-binding NtrC family response regulator